MDCFKAVILPSATERIDTEIYFMQKNLRRKRKSDTHHTKPRQIVGNNTQFNSLYVLWKLQKIFKEIQIICVCNASLKSSLRILIFQIKEVLKGIQIHKRTENFCLCAGKFFWLKCIHLETIVWKNKKNFRYMGFDDLNYYW